ncbi:MAG: YggT family protein [Armatimonadota bacterium]|nr:YggT family protein [Armatimonadota bacterium]
MLPLLVLLPHLNEPPPPPGPVLVLLFLLRMSHWIVLSYGWVLVARAILDSVLMFAPRYRRRLLGLDNFLMALTDPLLEPIRTVCRPFLPLWLDSVVSPFIGVIFCLILDALIVFCYGRL